jgi:hypothetical protein
MKDADWKPGWVGSGLYAIDPGAPTAALENRWRLATV